MSIPPPALFIAGIGNTMRRDDGIGPLIAQALSGLSLQQTDISFPVDLNVEWLEIFAQFEVVMLIDACADGSDRIRLEKVDPANYHPTRSSHYLDPGTISAVVAELFSTRPILYTCSVPGFDFSMEEGLSAEGQAAADKAIEILQQWLTENGYLSEN